MPIELGELVIVPAKTRDLCGKSICWEVVFGASIGGWSIGT
jgi:hypothetical protein